MKSNQFHPGVTDRMVGNRPSVETGYSNPSHLSKRKPPITKTPKGQKPRMWSDRPDYEFWIGWDKQKEW